MPRYAPAERLERLRTLLRSRRSTLSSLVDRLGVSESTVRRLLQALESAGEPLQEETLDDGRKAWKLPPGPKEHTVRLTTAQLVALLVARNGARELLRRASDGEERPHPFDPYSLVTCKKGLYLVG